MDISQPYTPEPDPATAAFARLADKVELLEAAITGLAVKREAVPDYSATLGEMAKRLGTVSQGLGVIADRPAMQLTPEGLAARIDIAAQAARRSDQATLADARERFDQGSRTMREITGTAQSVREQRRRLLRAAGGGLFAGILLWSLLPGAIARATPDDWRWPERIATRMLDAPTRWEAGIRLMRTAHPQAWQALIEAAETQRDNREAIGECRAEAVKARKAARCTILIEPTPEHRS